VTLDKCITVYLDTQDFARLYKEDISEELSDIKKQLINFKESGRVKFPLSFLTLFEFIQDYPSEFESDRQKRSEFMSEICGTNTLPYFLDKALKGSQVDESTWLPHGALDKFSVSQMLSVLRHTIKESKSIPRQTKRDLQNPLILKNYLRDYLNRQTNSGGLSTTWNADIPEFSFEFFVDYLLGYITELEANMRFRQSVFEPAKFFAIWYKRFSNKNALQQFFGEPIDKLYQSCLRFHEQMPLARENFNEAKKNLQFFNTEYSKLRKQHPELEYDENLKRRDIPKAPTWNEVYQGSTFAEKLNLLNDETKSVFEKYFSDISAIRFKPKKSDIVDAFHTVYISESDLWRTDRAWADFLLRAEIFPKEKIVTSLQELPSKIENLLK
jgi:hypothetical protein